MILDSLARAQEVRLMVPQNRAPRINRITEATRVFRQGTWECGKHKTNFRHDSLLKHFSLNQPSISEHVEVSTVFPKLRDIMDFFQKDSCTM